MVCDEMKIHYFFWTKIDEKIHSTPRVIRFQDFQPQNIVLAQIEKHYYTYNIKKYLLNFYLTLIVPGQKVFLLSLKRGSALVKKLKSPFKIYISASYGPSSVYKQDHQNKWQLYKKWAQYHFMYKNVFLKNHQHSLYMVCEKCKQTAYCFWSIFFI